MVIFISIFAFLISFTLCLVGKGRFLLAFPNERSAHHKPTSRFGGIAIFTSLATANVTYTFLTGDMSSVVTLVMTMVLAILVILGAFDDRKHLHPLIRLMGQMLFSLLAMYLLSYNFPFFSTNFINSVVGLFLMLAFINAANFSDGLNGLWSGTFLLWAGYVGYFWSPMPFLWMMMAATFGFFVLNFPKGKVFLGDSGSTLLGGFALLYGLYLSHHFRLDFYFLTRLTIIFAPFIFIFADIVMTLVLRVAQGHSPFTPHKEHFYQKLIHRVGLSHGTVTTLYLFGSILSSFFIGFLTMKHFWVIGFAFYIPLQLLFFGGVYRWCHVCGLLKSS